MNEAKQHYATLDLAPGTPIEEVEQAYRDLVKVWHPDRFAHDPPMQEMAQEKLKEINIAHDYLRSFLAGGEKTAAEDYPDEGQSQSDTKAEEAHSPFSEPGPQQAGPYAFRSSSYSQQPAEAGARRTGAPSADHSATFLRRRGWLVARVRKYPTASLLFAYLMTYNLFSILTAFYYDGDFFYEAFYVVMFFFLLLYFLQWLVATWIASTQPHEILRKKLIRHPILSSIFLVVYLRIAYYRFADVIDWDANAWTLGNALETMIYIAFVGFLCWLSFCWLSGIFFKKPWFDWNWYEQGVDEFLSWTPVAVRVTVSISLAAFIFSFFWGSGDALF